MRKIVEWSYCYAIKLPTFVLNWCFIEIVIERINLYPHYYLQGLGAKAGAIRPWASGPVCVESCRNLLFFSLFKVILYISI
jgi:hypothetical protein